MENSIRLFCGDNIEIMRTIPDNSVDSIVTDAPYGLMFMGKAWDYDVPGILTWSECLRVLKPGGHLLSFFGTRTYHRGVVKIEDAGFEIRDQIQWLYGSGFPKSTDVSKRIDKEAGAEREVVGEKKKLESYGPNKVYGSGPDHGGVQKITTPSTPEAKQWQGWGTALKPANEPIVVARKPLEKGLTVAQNVLKWGTGALNIDGSRIDTSSQDAKAMQRANSPNSGRNKKFESDYSFGRIPNGPMDTTQGRWPANVIFDEIAAEILDEQACLKDPPSRFFYQAKASKAERNAGLEGMPLVESGIKNDSGRVFSESDPHKKVMNQNFHPTVKPIKLMSYLINLVTPPGGVVLEPFMGSGSTGVAAKNLGRKFIGIEKDPDYFEIAKRRIEAS